MKTTSIKNNNPLNLKTVGIFFMVLFNIVNMSSQNAEAPPVKATSAKIYTILIARTFPIITSPATQELAKMEETEIFEHNNLSLVKSETQTEISNKIITVNICRTNKKNQKTKIAPKLHS